MTRRYVMYFEDFDKPSKQPKYAILGPTGSGKSHWGLAIATVCAGNKPIAMLDTEGGRGKLFKAFFQYKYRQIEPPYDPRHVVEAIQKAEENNFGAVVIDSLAHFWNDVGGLLDKVNNTRGNTYTEGWGKVGTPTQKRMMGAIINAQIPVIVTCRVKMAHEVQKNEQGKSIPIAIGLKPEQRDGFEYDLDIILNLTMDHAATVSKIPPIPGVPTEVDKNGIVEFAERVNTWMLDGVPPMTLEELKARMGDNEAMKMEARKLWGTKTPQQIWDVVSVSAGNGVHE
jgi:hypothetical protein